MGVYTALMRKKFLLFVGGSIVAVGGFTAYTYLTGADLKRHGGRPVVDEEPPRYVQQNDIATPTFEFRDNNGRLQYMITAQTARPLGKGKYDLVEPRASYYTNDSDNTLMRISAEGGQVEIDSLGGKLGGGDPNKPQAKFQLKGGRLSRNVVLTVGPQDSFVAGTTVLQPRQLQAQFEQDIELNYVDRVMSSPGKLRIRGELNGQEVAFDGQDLTLLLNQDQKRIEYMRVFPNGPLKVKTVQKQVAGRRGGGTELTGAAGPAGGVGGGGAKQTEAGGSVVDPVRSSAGGVAEKDKEKTVPTVYRMVFGKVDNGGVKATIGTRQLVADEMAVIFQAAAGAVQKAKPVSTGGVSGGTGEPSAGNKSEANQTGFVSAEGNKAELKNDAGDSKTVGEPASPATPELKTSEELVVTWNGPLEMRPVPAAELGGGAGQIQLAGGKDLIFEAISRRGRAVVVTEGDTQRMTAGQVGYRSGSKSLRLDPGALPNVELSDTQLGKVVCMGLSYDPTLSPHDNGNGKVLAAGGGEGAWLGGGLVTLTGPGRMETRTGALNALGSDNAGGTKGGTKKGEAGAEKEPVVATWTKSVELTLRDVPDLKRPGKTTAVVRRAVLTGQADLRDPTLWIHGDTLDALIATGLEPGSKPGDPPRRKQGLEHLLATGNVQVESIRNNSPEARQAPDTIQGQRLELITALPAGAAGNRGGVGGHGELPQPARLLVDGEVVALMHQPDRRDASKVLSDKITTSQMVVLLEPKKAARADTDKTGQTVGNVGVRELRAAQGVKVELEGYGKDLVVATAQTLLAQPSADNKSGSAVLTGTGNQPVVLERGHDKIQGLTMMLDQKNQSIEIPGAGVFEFLPPPKEGGEAKVGEANAGNPVRMTWQKSMKYDGRLGVADFNGPVRAWLVGKPDQESILMADNMRVTRAAAGGGGGGGAGDVATANLKLSQIHAMGHVTARGATFDPDHKMLTRMLLNDVAELLYDDSNKALVVPGPGQMLVEDYRPDNAGKGGEPGGGGTAGGRGQTSFAWQESLTYLQRPGEPGEIKLNKNVQMIHVPLKPVRAGAAGGAAGGKGAGPAGGINRVELTCQNLRALLVSGKSDANTAASSNPLGLGSNEGAKVTRVDATGPATDLAMLKINEDKVRLAAESLLFDALHNQAVATSKVDSGIPAHAESADWGMMNADQIIWDMTKDPANKDLAFKLVRPRLSSR